MDRSALFVYTAELPTGKTNYCINLKLGIFPISIQLSKVIIGHMDLLFRERIIRTAKIRGEMQDALKGTIPRDTARNMDAN